MSNNTPDFLKIDGYVEGIRDKNYCGWIWCVGFPDIKPVVTLTIDGEITRRATADIFRGDLLAAGKSDGRAGYVIALPPDRLDGRDHRLTLHWEASHDGEAHSGLIRDETLRLEPPAPGGSDLKGAQPDQPDAVPGSPPFVIEGFFDGLRGRTLTGWVWCVGHPQLKPEVEVFFDGERIGSVIASGFRIDLRDDGKSDGCAAYSFAMPADRLDGQVHDIELTWSVSWNDHVYRGSLLETPFRVGLPKAEPLLDGWLVHRHRTAGDGCPTEVVRGAALVSIPETANALAHLARQDTVSIIVHIGDGDPVAECLEALVRHTSYPCQLVLIDDGTADPAVQGRLRECAARAANIEVWRNPRPIGYAGSLVRGIARTTGDLVLLRGTVRVTPGWLQGLLRAAARAADVGVVTPLSRGLAWLRLEPDGDEALARGVARWSHRVLPANPGFPSGCLFLRRGVVDQLAHLALSDSFAPGHVAAAFCAQAVEAGWSSVLADDVLVLDGGSPEVADTDTAAAFARAYPAHHLLVERATGSDAYGVIAGAVAVAAGKRGAPIRPRLLYVLSPPDHSGTPLISFSLARRIRDDYEPWFLWGEGNRIHLAVMSDAGAAEPVASWTVNADLVPWDTRRGDVDAVLYAVLRQFDIGLVHCRQVVQIGLSITRIAQALGIPVALSFHDFYLVCPTVTLLDGNGRFCGGDCAAGGGDCRAFFIPEHSLPLRDGWVRDWRRFVGGMLRFVDAFVTTTRSAYDILAAAHPDLRQRDFRIIEHGRSFPVRHRVTSVPGEDRPVRLLALGNYNDAKGMQTVLDLADLDGGGRLEIHWLGAVPGVTARPRAGIYHGPYQPDEVIPKIREIAPDFVLLLSTWAETYCHTLSESWAAGVPVIGSRLGAIGARIAEHGGGWAVDPRDAGSILDLVARLSRHPEEYRMVAGRIPGIPIRPTDAMVADYLALYADLVRRRLALAGTR